MNQEIHFPHLGIHLEHVGKSISIFGFEIAFYGITIAIAMLAGMALAFQVAKKTGQNQEDYYDMAIIGIVVSLIGARLYYVIFSWDLYKDNLLSIFNTREGGMAIYGGVIAAAVMMLVFSKVKKIPFGLLADTVSTGLVLGQIIGRWGNFFNREAFGGYTDSLFAMQLPLDMVRREDVTAEMMDHLVQIGGVDFIQVHPTFLYESLWNVGVLIILLLMTKRKKFHGEIFLLYLGGYGLGRAWIEGLRTDQLLLPLTGWPVSQVLAFGMVVLSVVLLIWNFKKTSKKSLLKGKGDRDEQKGKSENGD